MGLFSSKEKLFTFRVTVKNVELAKLKVNEFFKDHNVFVSTRNEFFNDEWSGKYWTEPNDEDPNLTDVVISIDKKPLGYMNFIIVNAVKTFLKGI